MHLTYDRKRNAAYFRLREAGGAAPDTVRVSDEVNVDLAPDGSVYGIELLNANGRLAGEPLVVDWGVNRLEIPLPEAV